MNKEKKTAKSRSLLSQIIRIFAVVILIILVTVFFIAGIGWWAGWQSEEKFKSAIQIAGLIHIALGFLGIKGNWDMTRSFEYQYSMSVSNDESWQRIQRSLTDFTQSFSFMLIMFASGGVCMVIGWLM